MEHFYGAGQDAVKPFRDALLARMAVVGGHLLSSKAPLTELPPLVLDAVNISVNVDENDWQLNLIASNEKQHRWKGQAIRLLV